jgi:hypothetical protein
MNTYQLVPFLLPVTNTLAWTNILFSTNTLAYYGIRSVFIVQDSGWERMKGAPLRQVLALAGNVRLGLAETNALAYFVSDDEKKNVF